MITNTKHDRFTFYCLTAISFLESTVSVYVDNLQVIFDTDRETVDWLDNTWRPEEAAHGDHARAFVQITWPEFDWEHAYAIFLANYQPRCDALLLRPTQALEALARCVTETETAMMYRCLASYTNDARLKEMLQNMSKDEIRHYRYFRDVFDRYNREERNSLWSKARTLVQRSSLVRDEDLAMAFAPLNTAWRESPPFDPMTWNDWLLKARQVMRDHFPFEDAKRMLFRPLRTGSWYEPMLFDMLANVVRKQYGVAGNLSPTNRSSESTVRPT